MPQQLTGLRVFIASPRGLDEERKAFHKALLACNERDAHRRNVSLIPVGWEITLGGMGRPQSLINEDLRKCDYFVLLLWDRWGSPTTDEPNPKYKSGSHEEYSVARECFDDADAPMQNVVVFFKAVEPRQRSDPGPELKQVLDFQTELQQRKESLYHTFGTPAEFVGMLEKHIADWVYRAERGEKSKGARPPAIQEAAGRATTDVPEAKTPPPGTEESAEPSGELEATLTSAERLADEGNLVDAETEFARAIVQFPEPDSFNRYGHFLRRIGHLSQAALMYESVLSSAQNDDWRAAAYSNLGVIHGVRGDLDQAERMQRKALEINVQLGRLQGMADQYGNLGLIHRTRGDLDEAERMHRGALEIHEQLGRLEGIAADYAALGLVHHARGDLDEAERMHRKALEIEVKLGRLEGMARQYGNLGVIHRARGDLDEADQMHRKSLRIAEELGGLEGMANSYGNLGVIHGERGNLEDAERMLRKGMEIEEKLDLREGMAHSYGNLGNVKKLRGDISGACELWTRSRGLYERMGMPHMVQQMQARLDDLPAEDP